jgi:hypothetical protein
LKLQEGIDDYNNKFLKYPCLRIYKEIVLAHNARLENFELLTSLVKEAKEAFEA